MSRTTVFFFFFFFFFSAKILGILFKLILIVESFMITLTDTSQLSLAACTEYLSSVFLERDLREI
jgi:hypothetical protein